MLKGLQSQFAWFYSLKFDGPLLREQGETLSAKALQILAYFENNCKRDSQFAVYFSAGFNRMTGANLPFS